MSNGRSSFLFAVLITVCATLSSCKRETPKQSPKTPNVDMTKPAPAALSRDEQIKAELATFDEKTDREIAEGKKDRAKLVTPAPKDFRPKARGRKIRMTLTLRKAETVVSGKLFYRLDVQNIGSETIYWSEEFFKNGWKAPGMQWSRILTEPSGKVLKILPAYRGHYGRLLKEIPRELFIKVLPGETVSPVAWTSSDDDLAVAEEGFRELDTRYEFETTGRYKLQFVYEDPALLFPSEDLIGRMIAGGLTREEITSSFERSRAESLGRVESNIVSFQVRP